VGLGERRLVAHRCKQVAGLAERQLGSRLAEGSQAAALAEEGIRVLGNVPELVPACGRFRVDGCGVGVVAGVLRELGAGGQRACSRSGKSGSRPSVSRSASSWSPAASAVRSIAPVTLVGAYLERADTRHRLGQPGTGEQACECVPALVEADRLEPRR
jgi:hypothetical protein